MNDYVIMPKADYQGACDAIRAKTGKTDLIKSGDMATEIEEIKTGGGGSSVSPKDVNFYDYDGTLLYSYTVAEAQALTELPELPTQEGLICQGWNCTLDTVNSCDSILDVGATYITDDGKTRLYMSIPDEERMTVPLYLIPASGTEVVIDWGDGSATETINGKAYLNHTYASAGDYIITLEPLNWEGVSGGLEFGGNSNTTPLFYSNVNGNIDRVYANMLKKIEIGVGVSKLTYGFLTNCYSVSTITIPKGVTSIAENAFYTCYSILCIIVPSSLSTINNSFGGCRSLKHLVLPDTVNYVIKYGLSNLETVSRLTLPNRIVNFSQFACYSNECLASVNIPNNLTTIEASVFRDCTLLAKVKIPSKVTSISSYSFAYNRGMKVYDFTSLTAVPTVATTSFDGIPTDCEIRVPAALYEEWIAATNWANLADKIVPV